MCFLLAERRSTVDPYRLPQTVVPFRYDLQLEPDLATSTFRGHVTIAVSIREPVEEIVCNAADLTIESASVDSAATGLVPARVALDEANERCRLTLDRRLELGEGRVSLSFRGTLNDKLRGFYRSTYRDATGTTRTLAATQFEATDARRAFPCWDEPSFKAVFATTLIIDPALTAVSNTAVASEKVEGCKKWVQFAHTMPMSTYLVAFVVGELEATEAVPVGQATLRVWCVPGKRHLASFGQRVGAASLEFFEQYYALPYPGAKLDLLAIPDFAAGAMENFGAITFRETALLVDEKTATHAELERIADVVAHENAHMWFGDLVTMSWWNGLWLNEAFATFMEMLAVDAWKPEWQRWTTFGVSRSAALSVDGLHATRPIEYPVAAPRDADAMFDVLTYEKGASVLRMLEQHIGPDVFRAGVRCYLKKHAYGNTETGDLWTALAEASGQAIPEIMDAWIFQPGYPLIDLSLEGNQLVLSQRRFTYLPAPVGEAATTKGSEQRWQTPVQIRLRVGDQSHTERVLLKEETQRLNLPDWFASVLVNEGGHGFYRVRYSSDLLGRLLGQGLDKLSAIERFNLLNDYWAMVQAGLLPLSDYLDLTARFREERDKNVWAILIGSFHTLNRILEAADRPRLEALVRDRVGPALAALGWAPQADESELTRQLRGDLLRTMGTLGNDPATQDRAAQLHAAPESVSDANVAAALIPVLAHAGDAMRYDDFVKRFRAAATPQEEQRYLFSLAAFRPAALVERTLTSTLDGSVRTQDAPFLLRSLLMSVHGRDKAWEYVHANWEAMERGFPTNGVRRLFEGVLGLTTPERETEVHAFVAAKKVDLGGRTLAQYLEQLHALVTLRQREGENLHRYLSQTARGDG
jgi:puromycin-sensitive aminopeptidase